MISCQWLVDAGLIYKSFNIETPKLLLAGFARKNIFKIFLLDVGLLAAMSRIPAKIIPLEVKAGTSRKKKSLLVYGEKYKPELLLRTSLLNLRKDGLIANIPLYLISRLVLLA